MIWHLTEKELPEEHKLVVAYIPNRPWHWNGKGDIHYKIVWLEKGISKKEREKLLTTDVRKNIYSSADEFENNKKPYCWNEFGPDQFFGQEVVAWAYFDEYKGELELL